MTRRLPQGWMSLMSRPADLATLEQPPHDRTAQRLTWKFLPPALRALVEERLGSPVVEAVSKNSGFTPGLASVLTGADGSRLFVKAANRKAQREIAESYAEEARKHRLLPPFTPAPELLWVHEDELWIVLAFEATDARTPKRPWRRKELDLALDLAEELAGLLDPVPEGLDLLPISEDIPLLREAWGQVRTLHPDWPHLDEAEKLAAGYPDLPDNRHFIHSDLRDDNVLITTDGRALACDWNWPALGPAWQDLVDLLVSAYGDGHDADAVLASRALTRDVDPAHIDAWLAALCGFMLVTRERPVPRTSPYLRVHARWYSEVLWSWLASRRGWS